MTTQIKHRLLCRTYLIYPFIIGLLVMLFPVLSKASHIVGGEIGYRCLGNNQYEITVNVYRDCFYGEEDAQFDDPASVGIFNARNNSILQELQIPFVEDDTLEAVFFDDCLFVPGDVCVHTTTYRDTVTLFPNNDGYRFVYQRCCRNQTIKNITEPDLTGATYEIVLTRRAMLRCNSSPTFRDWPPIFICVNKPIFYNHSAEDIDGDSLVYRLCTPLAGATKDMPQPQPPSAPPYEEVNWVDPTYNVDNVLGAGRELTINPETGFIVGRPALQGQYVVGVCVEEYRNGELLSVTRRDFQYNVGMCRETVAEISAPNVQCDNLTVNFESLSQDFDVLVWNFNFPSEDSTFISMEENPTFTYPDTGRYTVQLIANPGSTCADTTFHELFLQNNSLNVDLDVEIYECEDSSILVFQDQTVDSIGDLSAWFWEITYGDSLLTSSEQNPTFFVPKNTAGNARLSVQSENGCVQAEEFPFQTGLDDPVNDLQDTIFICEGDTVGLNANVDPETEYEYRWRPAIAIDDPNVPNPQASPENTTTYFVRISPPNDLCQFERSVTVVVVPPIQADFATAEACDSGLERTFLNNSTEAQGFEWTISGGNIADTTVFSENLTYAFPDSGQYNVQLVSSASVCTDTIVKTVSITDNQFEADFDVEYTSCGDERLTVRFVDQSIVTGTTIDDWDWTFSNGEGSNMQSPQLVFDSSQTIDVQLIVTGENECVDTLMRSVDIQVLDISTLPDSVIACPGDSVELFPGANPNYLYFWTPADGLSDPTAPNPLAAPTESTTYQLSIASVSADTCALDREVRVFVPPTIAVEAGEDVTTCADTVLLEGTVGVDALRLRWVNDTNAVLSTEERVQIIPSGVQNIRLEAEDIYGCVFTDSVRITGGPLNIESMGDQAVCEGEEVQVGVINTDSNDTLLYQWFPLDGIISGGTTPNPVVEPVVGRRTYRLIAQSQYGCLDSASVQVAVVPDDLALDFESTIQCDGITAEFTNTSQNGFNYKWLFGDTLNTTSSEVNPMFTYPESNTYIACLTLGYDLECVDTICKPIEITEANLRAAFDFEYLSCSADSAVIAFNDLSFSSFGEYSVLWQFGDSLRTSTERNPTVTFYEGGPTDISLSIMSNNACETGYTETIDIQVLNTNIADTIMTICAGEAVELNPGGNEDYLYLWTPTDGLSDPTAANPLANPSESTTYNVIIQSPTVDLCRIERQVTLTLTEGVDLGLPEEVTICSEPITLRIEPDSSFTYVWRDTSGNSVRGDSVVVAEDYTGFYYLEAMNEQGCVSMDSVLIRNNSVSMQIAGLDTVLACEGQEFLLVAINGRPEDELTYNWMPTEPIISQPNRPTIRVSWPRDTTIIFSVVAENQFGCVAEDTVTVEITNFDSGLPDDIQICANTPTELNPDFNPDFEYTWSPAGGLDDPNSDNPIATLSNSRIYRVTVTVGEDARRCEETKDVMVQVYPSMNLAVEGDTIVCDENEVILTATAENAVSYEWAETTDFEELLSMSTTLTVLPDTGQNVYFVRSEDTFGCADTVSIRLSKSPLDLFVPSEIDFCLDSDPIQIEVTNNSTDQMITYSWQPTDLILEGANTATPTILPEKTTDLELIASNQFGCTGQFTTTINVIDLIASLEVTADPDTIVLGGSAQLQTSGGGIGYTYEWTPAASLNDNTIPNPIASPLETTTYNVEVRLGDCLATENVEVAVRSGVCEEPFIFVPSAFTPNGDGENDVLFVRGNPIDEVYFAVFNRWGQQVFESTSKDIGWDGTFQDKELPPDVFAYYLEVRCVDGERFFKKGNVTLLR